VNSILKGTAAEMIVAADLMDKGFYVFHGLSGREPFGLIAYASNTRRIWRVKVKSSMMMAGAAYERDYDVLAVAHSGVRAVEYCEASEEFMLLCGEADRLAMAGEKGLTARIREVMRHDPSREWLPREIAQVLGEDTRACRERMRQSPLLDRNETTGRYILIKP
jgi:hypothetical protein